MKLPSLVPGTAARIQADTLASRENFLAHLEQTSAALRAWRMPDLGDAFRAPATTDAPTLFVAARSKTAGTTRSWRPAEVHAAVAGLFSGKTETPATIAMPTPKFVALIAPR